MRTALFCCLLLVSLAQVFQAQESPKPSNNQSAAQNSAAPDPSNHPSPRNLRLHYSGSLQSLDSQSGEEFCTYIRAYRVRREYKGSDSVTLAGYTTCVPSTRFEFRSAVITHTEPSLNK